MRVVVLGGTGYLGAKVVSALGALDGAEVVAASRRGPAPVDVARPGTFAALERADVVVDLTDATSTPPDAVVGFCLEKGLTVIEATSDAPCVERLHGAFATKGLPGRLVLGGGFFTGVSNLPARAVAERAKATALTLGIASSPFSGAGRGTIGRALHRRRGGALAHAGARQRAGRRGALQLVDAVTRVLLTRGR
ncbi:MAG: hypothetical protein AB1730_13565 [Myxococcota bacterium]|jgi:saccharopine dehydrogenase-like NADP-dependent oxidoreductase